MSWTSALGTTKGVFIAFTISYNFKSTISSVLGIEAITKAVAILPMLHNNTNLLTTMDYNVKGIACKNKPTTNSTLQL